MGLDGSIGDRKIVKAGKEKLTKKVDSLRTTVMSKEEDSMNAMRFRMSMANKAMWTNMKFKKNKGIAEGRKHKRCGEVVQACILHSFESWMSCTDGGAGIWIS